MSSERPTHTGDRPTRSYRQLFAQNGAIQLLIDPQTMAIVDANPAACAFYGYPREVLMGMTINEINMLSGEELAAELADAAEEQRAYFFFRHRLASGEMRDVEMHSGPILLGERQYLYAIVHDISARKRAERALQEAQQTLRESEAKYRLLFESNPQPMWVYDSNTLRFLAVNESAVSRYGYSRAEFLTMTIADIRPPDDVPALIRATTEGIPVTGLWRHRTKSGAERWVEITSHATQFDGRAAHLVISTDVSERKRAEDQLRLQAAALTSAANAIMITDRLNRITWINPAFTQLTAYDSAEVVGRTSDLLECGEQDRAFYHQLNATIQAGQVWQGELINQRKDGTLYAAEQTITPVLSEQGTVTHFITIMQDITERKHNEQQIRYLASHDSLTGLANRLELESRLERMVVRVGRGQESTLLFLDMDNFKLVNDTVGHNAGDQLLIVLSGLVGEALRPSDLLTRVGADHFAVLLEGTPLDQARLIAESLRGTVDAYPFYVGGRNFALSLSLGLVAVDGTVPAGDLLAQADSAMHTAKRQGGNRVAVYHPDESTLSQLSAANGWVRRIKLALRDDQLVLHYQPVTRLSDGAIVHYEALLRMLDENGSLIMPGAFIAAAERFGLMPPLDRWVVRGVVAMLRDHSAARIFMNLSGRSLADEGLLEFIRHELAAADVAPARLGFEITETAAVQDFVRAEHWIREAKTLGCRFALDDFGVGFTSFAYLRSLPVDQIKIDGSFIRTLEGDSSNRHIVQAMHTLARSLGKETVAEFVESAAIQRIVREIGVTYAQGYYQGLPLAGLVDS
ncbi:MAG: EAL domain-containing protein [Chloroflexota bacterium]|nr:EAL domain-containing protein [Chloroflexota bacterium]